MERKTLKQLKATAEVRSGFGQRERMSRRARLDRWAALLERHRGPLRSLRGTEYANTWQREVMREDNSPISVAYADPVLREEGLRSDTLGEAMRFFELSDHDAHLILCYCHHGAVMSPQAAAERVRACRGYGVALNSRTGLTAGIAAVPLAAIALAALLF